MQNSAPTLLMLVQNLRNLSDEMMLEQWLESPIISIFVGKRFGEEDYEWLLTQTIQAGLKLKVIKSSSLKWVVVDTTVQEKNIASPKDSALYNKSRQQLVSAAKSLNITLRQSVTRAHV